MYRQFNIQQFYVLPTRCIYVFCVDLKKIALHSINWLDFKPRVCLLRGTDWIFKYNFR